MVVVVVVGPRGVGVAVVVMVVGQWWRWWPSAVVAVVAVVLWQLTVAQCSAHPEIF
jgi:hypothetical protein